MDLLWADAANHRFAMERIGGELENWQVKLADHVNLDTVARADELLAQLHVRSAQRPDLTKRFDRREFFEQLRIEPFFMRSAERNPQARQSIQRVVNVLRLPGRALVHGDYSPKNILAHAHRKLFRGRSPGFRDRIAVSVSIGVRSSADDADALPNTPTAGCCR